MGVLGLIMVKCAARFAGPVENNRCAMTNLDWVIDGSDLTKRHGVKFAILNDFEANGGLSSISWSSSIAPCCQLEISLSSL